MPRAMGSLPDSPRVLAVGGGGFTQGSDPPLDDLLLSESGAERPRLGYIGAASDDDPQRIVRFYERFSASPCTPSHLPAAVPFESAAAWVMAQDVIYVGGGNTVRLMEGWRATGLDAVLAAAARSGTLLAGVSAGAVCWFEFALTPCAGAGLTTVAGLGLIAGSCCAHHSSEPRRVPAYREAVARGRLPDGIAIDDGVAVLLSPDRPPRARSARAGCWAYSVRRSANGVESARLDALR